MRNNEDYVPKQKCKYPKTDMLKIQRRLSVPHTVRINNVLSLFIYKLLGNLSMADRGYLAIFYP